MDYIIAAIFVFLMAVAGRAHGSASKDEITGAPTGWPTWDRTACLILYGVSFAAGDYMLFGVWWLALLAGVLSILALNTGHGRFYGMQGANLNDPNPEFIEKAFGWMYPGAINKPGYSWFCMGIKAFFVGLAVFPYGLPLVVLWPLGYYLSLKYTYDTAAAEWWRGFYCGLILLSVAVAYIFG